jgi:hypothetical protein
MQTSGVSRRSFLVGAAAGLALASTALSPPAEAEPASALIVEPAKPRSLRRYISRPDLTPPAVNVVTAAGFPYTKSQPRYIFLAAKVRALKGQTEVAQRGLMILDQGGELVWFQPVDTPGHTGFNFRVQTYKGKPTLTWFDGAVGVAVGYATSGHYVLADASYQPIATVTASGWPCDLHEFLLTSEGTALHTSYQEGVPGPAGTITVGHAQEIDVATNGVVFDWPCYPDVAPSESYAPLTGDYFHINSIDIWPGPARNLLISARNTCAVYLVDRATKQVIWRLNGKKSNFKMGKGTPFTFQHDARPLADGSGLSLFDDAGHAPGDDESSGKVITLDQKSMSAGLRHRYYHTTGALDTRVEGNCQLLPNGGHFISWGAQPYFSCFRPSGAAMGAELILDGRLPPGVDTYRAFMFDWVGDPPQNQLRLVVQPSGGSGHFTAWVSWNGATEVAAWRLEAGPSAHSLEVLKTVKKRWFETPIEFTRTGAKAFRCAALNTKGAVISRTAVVAAS